MIPYIIINGVSSKQVNGLLIQSLPPISKPKIRTEVEEIDGRDGDIVTNLGYQAYDKPISIGLKGDYNVDDVISYFNTSGKVTFSNELDKYYNFSIYDTIDFNKLLRFKTATVKMHVQPFKYLIEEPLLKWTNAGYQTIAELSINNMGNEVSKPVFTVNGAGEINVYRNNVLLLTLDLAAAGQTIILDVAGKNSKDTAGNFLNRKVTGDLDSLILNKGLNKLTFTGLVNSIQVTNYSRWT